MRRIIKDLALQRVRKLYTLAVNEVRLGNYDRARRYVEIALNLISKANVRKPMYLRRGICKNCYVPLIPGLTATVRLRGNRKYIMVVRKCLLCGWVSRVPCPRKK
ncbi:MAG: ribonuclease P [Desulfurococcales archaeon ex4484_42]|nr:MAG: ribonuclease P [Desulfurococcales archaeon ex4484_42]